MRSTSLISLGLVLVVAAVASASLMDLHWFMFKNQFDKSYSNGDEELLRMQTFAANKEIVDKFNQNDAQTAGWRMGLNHLSDWTEEEYKRFNALRVPVESDSMENSEDAQQFLDTILNDASPVPESVDWRKVPGKVTEVKNQGRCGGCWAFATTGLLEGQKHHNQNWTGLSEQDLIDCSESNKGCSGGFMAYALRDIKEMGGIEEEVAYPYKARDGRCKFSKRKAVMSDDAAVMLPKDDEIALKKVVARYGPVSVAIAASPAFQHYQSGVFDDKSCAEMNLNHAVLVVGYGSDETKGDYWIIKNSWSFDWGEDGYIRYARGKNMCQVASMGTIAAVHKH